MLKNSKLYTGRQLCTRGGSALPHSRRCNRPSSGDSLIRRLPTTRGGLDLAGVIGLTFSLRDPSSPYLAISQSMRPRRLAFVSLVVTEQSRAQATARSGSLSTYSGASSVLENEEQQAALHLSYHTHCHAARSSSKTTALVPEGPSKLLSPM